MILNDNRNEHAILNPDAPIDSVFSIAFVEPFQSGIV